MKTKVALPATLLLKYCFLRCLIFMLKSKQKTLTNNEFWGQLPPAPLATCVSECYWQFWMWLQND